MIATRKTTTKPPVATKASSNVVLDNDMSIKRAIKNIEGSDWALKGYYNQILGADNNPSTFDTNRTTADQQYTLIEKLVISLTTPIETVSSAEVEGEAYLPSSIVPIVGDMFKARLIDGVLALFRVTNVESNAYVAEKIYKIAFRIDTKQTVDPDRYDAIDAYVAKELVFDQNIYLDGKDPLLVKKEYIDLQNLIDLEKELQHRYYQSFYNAKTGYLLYKTEDNKTIFDAVITNLYQSITDTEVHPIKDITVTKENTIIDRIMGRYQNMPIGIFNNKYASLITSGEYNRRNKGRWGIINGIPFSIAYVVDINDVPSDTVIKYNISALANEYIYKEDDNRPLSSLITKYLNSEAISYDEIKKVVDIIILDDSLSYWYTPILMVLSKYASDKIFTIGSE